MYITRELQRELFDRYNTPKHVQAHCNAVAETARVLACKLNEFGYHLDVDMIYGAGLVHDVVRVEEHHDLRGAEILGELGYYNEADLVRQHMKYRMPNDAYHLEEIDVLCLADRVVKENEYVGLDDRIDYLLHKPGITPDKRERIILAREHTRTIIHGIEGIIGMTFDELLG